MEDVQGERARIRCHISFLIFTWELRQLPKGWKWFRLRSDCTWTSWEGGGARSRCWQLSSRTVSGTPCVPCFPPYNMWTGFGAKRSFNFIRWIRWCSKNTQARPHWSLRSWECGSSGSFPARFQSWKSPQRCSIECCAARLAPGWERWWPCCVFWPTDEGATALMFYRPARCRSVARLSPHLLTETRGVPIFSRLGKLRPRILFTGAEGKGHGCREQRRPIDWGGNLTNFMEPCF